MGLLRDVVWFGIASKLSLLSPYTTLRSISSHFEYSLSPLLGVEAERTQSEPRANPERRQNDPKVEATVCYNYTQKNKIQGAAFLVKKGCRRTLFYLSATSKIDSSD